METMKVGVIGLGRMGEAVVYRLLRGGHDVVAFDLDEVARTHAQTLGAQTVVSVEAVAQNVSVIWLMVPAGPVVDQVLEQITPLLQEGAIVVDGGNSHFPDSQRRAQQLKERNRAYLDCGTSGGINGRTIGFSLMIGGNKKAFTKIEPLFQALAAPDGYAYLGPSGAGHYVKMVHNGIEYALMQAYAEGLHLLHDGDFKELDLEAVTRVWMNGSVIRSWLVELVHNVMQEDQNVTNVSGKVGGGQTGRWTVQEADKQKIPVRLIAEALAIRDESQTTGGNYATKLVALLRNQFGGHSIEKIK